MKITQVELEEYMWLKERMRSMEKRLKELNDAIRERGSGPMGSFMVNIVDGSRRCLPSLKDLEEKYQKLYKQIVDLDLIKNVSYQTVDVKRRISE